VLLCSQLAPECSQISLCDFTSARVARQTSERVLAVSRGNLVLDCRDFNHSGMEQCFTAGSSQPQPCVPPPSGQPYPKLLTALSRGQAIDGNEGSLCVLNKGGPLPAGAKSPFIPASSGGGGCNLGLSCLSLGVRCHPAACPASPAISITATPGTTEPLHRRECLHWQAVPRHSNLHMGCKV
jgi:hypothetical protein